MFITAILLAAGKGLRLKSGISKALVEINSKPVVIYSLYSLSRHPGIKDIIVVANSSNLAGIRQKIKKYRIGKIKDVVLGGKERQDSVINGLKAIDKSTNLVLIHDAGRPFIDSFALSAAIKEARTYGAAILGVPVKATIKKVKSKTMPARSAGGPAGRQELKVKSQFVVEETLDRSKLWEIQTPQVFKKDLILEAYKKHAHSPVTDDASLVERLGYKVRVVRGSYSNIKITTPDDLILAEAIARNLGGKG
jgi:2-C-methyl-D-erythritol 4-phosphate cytidylyltransferase